MHAARVHHTHKNTILIASTNWSVDATIDSVRDIYLEATGIDGFENRTNRTALLDDEAPPSVITDDVLNDTAMGRAEW